MSRHFVQIGQRQVHYRRWGSGPAVLAIHGSPQSSRAVEAFGLAGAAAGRCVIAPDTPGNGRSTPLPGEPSSADYAKALHGFADALGLGRVGLYGYHTGAATSCAFAALYPERTAAVFFNGLSCWTEDERTSLLATYLPRFIPSWDGAHMDWAWARLEEHTIFFPWTERTREARMTYDIAPVEAMQNNAIDLLESGDNYRAPYASAFAFRTEDWLHRVTTPFRLATTRIDPLLPQQTRPPLDSHEKHLFEDMPALVAAAVDYLAARPGDPAPAAPAGNADMTGLTRGFVTLPGGEIAWRGSLEGSGRPLVLLHEAGGSSRVFEQTLIEHGGQNPVLAVDLPGHGDSFEGWQARIETVQGFAAIVHAALISLGIEQSDFTGQGLGHLIAQAAVTQGFGHAATDCGPERVFYPPGAPGGKPPPTLSPEWDGGHLLQAFRIARYERLFHPWYLRDRVHAIPQGNLDPADIQRRALDLVRARERWLNACYAEALYRFPQQP